MSRARYYFQLDNARSLPEGSFWRWFAGIVGAMSMGAAAFLFVGNGFSLLPEDGGAANFPIILQLLLWGSLFLAHATGLSKRYLTTFVDISLGSVRWRLPAADGSEMWPKYRQVSLARVRDIRVEVLRIDFVMASGEVLSMPLGALPYQVLKEVKSRFEGRESLAGATGAQIVDCTAA